MYLYLTLDILMIRIGLQKYLIKNIDNFIASKSKFYLACMRNKKVIEIKLKRKYMHISFFFFGNANFLIDFPAFFKKKKFCFFLDTRYKFNLQFNPNECVFYVKKKPNLIIIFSFCQMEIIGRQVGRYNNLCKKNKII